MSIGRIGRMAMVANSMESRRRRDDRGRFMGGDDDPQMRNDQGNNQYTRERRNSMRYDDDRTDGGYDRENRDRPDMNSRTAGGEGWFAWDGMNNPPPGRYPPPRYESPKSMGDRGGDNITDMRTYERMRPSSRMGGGSSREGQKIGFGQGRHEEDESAEHISLDDAQRWVASMEWIDPKTRTKKKGPRWTYEEIKQYADNFGVKGESEVIDFFAAINAMYTDYVGVATKFGLDKPEFYAELAKAFIHDKDAEDGKIRRYYQYIAEHDD